MRIRAREVGDAEGLEREESKRRGWVWENALRRHNFVGLVGEMLKGVVRTKVREGDGAYEKWIEEGIGRTKARMEKGKRGGGEGEEKGR